jgi:hypothetical protein
VPESVSIFSVLSSCHVMCKRPGTRMMPGALYALQDSPAA